jgi:hypothetical protein
MALEGLAEFILRPILEIAFEIAGYLTGYVVVPLLTFGRVFVEPDKKGWRAFSKGKYLVRRPDGKLVMQAELGALCGLAFWAVIVAGLFIYHSNT